MPAWGDSEIKLAANMWRTGYSARDIGAALGKTRNAVLGQFHRMGMTKPVWSRMSDTMLAHRLKGRRIAMKKAAKMKPAAPAGVEPFLKPLCELKSGECRYPYGGTVHPSEMLFCGVAHTEPGSYCPYHAKLCFQPRQSR